MIIYSHPRNVQPPPWLVGSRNLSFRQSLKGYLTGVGPSVFLRPLEAPVDLEDGWQAEANLDFDPYTLQRDIRGIPMVIVEDSKNRSWHAPIVIMEDGTRAFKVKYGADWKPSLTPEQKTLMDFATIAKTELPRFLSGNPETREELAPVLCQCAAVALAYVNHISVEAIQKLEFMDEILMVGVASAMSSALAPTE